MRFIAALPALLLLGACATNSTSPRSVTPVSDISIAETASSQHNAPINDTWASNDTTSRHLLIMGTIDGFSATALPTPCFLGQDNNAVDAALTASGFAQTQTASLPKALATLPGAKLCEGRAQRGYDTGLLKSMPDEHLAIYLTGAVRGYAQYQNCPEQHHQYAAATAAAAIYSATSTETPASVLQRAFAEGCRGADAN